MNYLTTADLRVKTKSIEKKAKILTQKDIESIKRLAKEMNLPKLSYEERERRYREHLEKKYG